MFIRSGPPWLWWIGYAVMNAYEQVTLPLLHVQIIVFLSILKFSSTCDRDGTATKNNALSHRGFPPTEKFRKCSPEFPDILILCFERSSS